MQLTVEAAFGPARLHSQHLVDALKAAWRKALIVELVTRGGAGEHDVVAVLAARHAAGVGLRVVRRPEVVPHLVCHGDVGHGGRHVLAVVHQGDDARVETLVTAAVVLQHSTVSGGGAGRTCRRSSGRKPEISGCSIRDIKRREEGFSSCLALASGRPSQNNNSETFSKVGIIN